MPSIIKIPVKFGALGAAVIVLIFLVYYFMGSNPVIEMDMLDLFILPIFLFFGIKEYRDRFNQGLLEFWQGMTVGFFVYILIAGLSALFIWVFIDLIDTSIVEEYIADRLKGLHEIKEKIIEEMGEDLFHESVDKVGNTTSRDIALDGFLKKSAIGFLLTSVLSVVLKRKK